MKVDGFFTQCALSVKGEGRGGGGMVERGREGETGGSREGGRGEEWRGMRSRMEKRKGREERERGRSGGKRGVGWRREREENYEGDHMAVLRRVTKECTIGVMRSKGALKGRVTW